MLDSATAAQSILQCLRLKCFRRYLPWRSRYDLAGWQESLCNHPTHPFGADLETFRGLLQCEHTGAVLAGVEAGQFILMPHRIHSPFVPRVPDSSAQSEPIQCGRNLFVGKPARQLSDDLNRFRIITTAVLPRPILFETQLGVTTTRPVNH